MAMTIDLRPELEAQLQAEAAKTGIDTSTWIARTVEERLNRSNRQTVPSHLSLEESTLLQKINQGLSESIWQEYHDLIAKRRAETLTTEEHARLIALSDSIEAVHAERMSHVAELAQLRQVPFQTLLDQLGIKPRTV